MRLTGPAAFPQLSQKFVRMDEERVLLEDPADNDHRMSPHDVSNEVPAKLSEIVRTYDWVDRAGLAKPYIVCPRFVLQKIINPGLFSKAHSMWVTNRMSGNPCCLASLTTSWKRASVFS